MHANMQYAGLRASLCYQGSKLKFWKFYNLATGFYSKVRLLLDQGRVTGDKHSCLLRNGINYSRKKL